MSAYLVATLLEYANRVIDARLALIADAEATRADWTVVEGWLA